jgi:hypothetical protein
MITWSEAETQLREYSKLLDEIRRQRALLSRQESGLIKMIEGLREYFPEIEDESETKRIAVVQTKLNGAEGPRGQEAIYRVLVESNRWMTLIEIAEELRKRGWATATGDKPEEAVRAGMKRLKERLPERVSNRRRGGSLANEFRIAPLRLDPTNSDAPAKTGASERLPNQGGLMEPP